MYALLAATCLFNVAVSARLSCKSQDLVIPSLFGLSILDITAEEKLGWNDYSATPLPVVPPLPVDLQPIDLCAVQITYTHPGLNDTLHVDVWLPLTEAVWNGRFLGQGGGGWMAGHATNLGPGVALGYATAGTDAGHDNSGTSLDLLEDSSGWSLTSPGNVNAGLLHNFASRAVDEMTRLAKSVLAKYYGREAERAFWHGCSTGGRQGLMLAQRSPELYDGILAVAPAINWVTFLVTDIWPQVVMKKLGYYPPACEMQVITEAAIKACDELDGVRDGLVAAHGLCKFDALSVVGKKFDCEGSERAITKEAALVANGAWEGPIQNGKPVWFGLAHEAPLGPSGLGLAKTTCDADNKGCKSSPFPVSADWIRHFVAKDPNFDPGNISEGEFYKLLQISRQQYFSTMDSAESDLREFQNSGGKIISWHGLADQVIAPNGTSNYYERVAEISPDIRDFFRHFEVPGVEHCAGGPGRFPAQALNELVAWVEKGIAPESLQASSQFAETAVEEGADRFCPYPLVAARQNGGASYVCAESFDVVHPKHDEL